MIVSNAPLKSIENFNVLDGVSVTERRCAIPVVIALRHSLIEVAGSRFAREGPKGKGKADLSVSARRCSSAPNLGDGREVYRAAPDLDRERKGDDPPLGQTRRAAQKRDRLDWGA